MTTSGSFEPVCHFDPFGRLRINSGRNLSLFVRH